MAQATVLPFRTAPNDGDKASPDNAQDYGIQTACAQTLKASVIPEPAVGPVLLSGTSRLLAMT